MTRELAFIERLRALATHPAARGLDDDCAVLPFGTETLILTHDMLVEGIHYLPGADMADVAWKLVATNLSDLASKGAEPLGVLLGHMLGPGDGDFLRGLEDVLRHYGVPLLGGDTTSGRSPRADGLTALGRASCLPVPSRSGAQPGDAVYLTGPVGAAMMGFEALRDSTGEDSTAYSRPMARLAEGQALAPLVTAMMDVSDGLLLDACRMARASSVTISLASASVPLGCPSGRVLDALRWGDDYELLFTAPEGTRLPVTAYQVGTILLPEGAPLLLDGTALSEEDELGYQHG
ncbi:thiamine-phosphate kinase [Altererythrobacter fulvus]|uniref:thiamine-phosphate kinase n=1 Tax=Caenibius fulvus TaxID=2126012 RepID=UPI003019AD6E